VTSIFDGTYFSILESELKDGVFYLGSKGGVSVLNKTGNHWSLIRDIILIGDDVYNIIEELSGNLWLTTRSGRIFNAKLDGVEFDLNEYSFNHDKISGQLTLARIYDEVLMLGVTGFYIPSRAEDDRSLK